MLTQLPQNQLQKKKKKPDHRKNKFNFVLIFWTF